MELFVESALNAIHLFFQGFFDIINFALWENTDEYTSIAEIGGGVNLSDRHKEPALEGEVFEDNFIDVLFDQPIYFDGSLGHSSLNFQFTIHNFQ